LRESKNIKEEFKNGRIREKMGKTAVACDNVKGGVGRRWGRGVFFGYEKENQEGTKKTAQSSVNERNPTTKGGKKQGKGEMKEWLRSKNQKKLRLGIEGAQTKKHCLKKNAGMATARIPPAARRGGRKAPTPAPMLESRGGETKIE